MREKLWKTGCTNLVQLIPLVKDDVYFQDLDRQVDWWEDEFHFILHVELFNDSGPGEGKVEINVFLYNLRHVVYIFPSFLVFSLPSF